MHTFYNTATAIDLTIGTWNQYGNVAIFGTPGDVAVLSILRESKLNCFIKGVQMNSNSATWNQYGNILVDVTESGSYGTIKCNFVPQSTILSVVKLIYLSSLHNVGVQLAGTWNQVGNVTIDGGFNSLDGKF